MFNIESYENIKKLVQVELDQVDEFVFNINSIYPDFDNALIDYFKAPSKKIRSVISFLFFKSLGYEISENIIKLQASIEIIHNATLIHDDIIDKSDLRRGLKTFNSKFDNSLAVISGDYLLSVALRHLLSLDNCEILNIFADTIDKMCVGEIHQYFDKFKIPSIEEYIEKSKAKTASLFSAEFESISVLCGFDKNVALEFANNFGIAFQIRDDILNFSNKDNKPLYNDYEAGIYTAPVIYAGGKLENISVGIEKAKQLLDNYLCACRDILNKIVKGDNIYKCAIFNILDLFSL